MPASQSPNSSLSMGKPLRAIRKRARADRPRRARRVSSEGYPCEICGRVYETGQALGGHQNRHIWERQRAEQESVLHRLHDATWVTPSPIVSDQYRPTVHPVFKPPLRNAYLNIRSGFNFTTDSWPVATVEKPYYVNPVSYRSPVLSHDVMNLVPASPLDPGSKGKEVMLSSLADDTNDCSSTGGETLNLIDSLFAQPDLTYHPGSNGEGANDEVEQYGKLDLDLRL